MAADRFAPVYRALFPGFFYSALGNAVFPGYVCAFLIGINTRRGIIAFKIGNVGALCFYSGNTFNSL